MAFKKYKVVETRLWVKKGTILVEKIDKKNRHSFRRIEKSKAYPITQESFKLRSTTFFNELATFKPVPERLEKRKEKVEVDVYEEYDEYEYFIGFDYETPTIRVEGKQVYAKGKHDFKTEFRVSSPVPLSDTEIKKVIQSKFSDYAVLKENDAYEIKSDSKTKSKKKPEFEAKFTEKITR